MLIIFSHQTRTRGEDQGTIDGLGTGFCNSGHKGLIICGLCIPVEDVCTLAYAQAFDVHVVG